MKENFDIISDSIQSLVNDSINNNSFPNKLKLAEILPLHKKEDACKKENYRPISILPSISKVFERVMQKQIAKHTEKYLFKHMFGYRKGYNTQNML